MIMMLLAILLPTLLGYLVVAAIFRNAASPGLLERLSLAFPIGIGLQTLQMFLLALARVPLTLGAAAMPLVIEIIALAGWLWYRRIRPYPPTSLGSDDLPPTGGSLLRNAAIIILVSWAAVKLGSVFVETWLKPIFAWDSIANWSASAKAFYYSQGLLLDVPAAEFFGKGLLNRNTNYPPHNPLMQVWMALFIGHFDEVLVKFWSPVYLLSLALHLYAVGSEETSRLRALAVLVLLLGSPMLALHGTEVYNDLPLSVYILFCLTALLRAQRGDTRYWYLLGLAAGLATFTKDEGLFFVLPLLASALVFVIRNRGLNGTAREAAKGLLVALPVCLPWFIFKSASRLGFGADYVTTDLSFHPEKLARFFELIVELKNFNVFLVFLPLLLIFGRPRTTFFHLLLPVIAYGLFFVCLYTFTSFFAGDLMFDTAVFRNLLTWYPSLAFLTLLLLVPFPSGSPAGTEKNTTIQEVAENEFQRS